MDLNPGYVRLTRAGRAWHGIVADEVRPGTGQQIVTKLGLAARASGLWHVLYCWKTWQGPELGLNMSSSLGRMDGAWAQLEALQVFADLRRARLDSGEVSAGEPSTAAMGALWIVEDFESFAQDREFARQVIGLARCGHALNIAVWVVTPGFGDEHFGGNATLQHGLAQGNVVAAHSRADLRGSAAMYHDPRYATLGMVNEATAVTVAVGNRDLMQWARALPRPNWDDMVRDGLSALL
jgi:hypothetical protein